jgi:hypothetical protein
MPFMDAKLGTIDLNVVADMAAGCFHGVFRYHSAGANDFITNDVE